MELIKIEDNVDTQYVETARKFVEFCKDGSINTKPFDFVVGEIILGTILVEHFNTLLFVTSVYGCSSNASIFVPTDFNDDFDFDEEDWERFAEEAEEHFFNVYKYN